VATTVRRSHLALTGRGAFAPSSVALLRSGRYGLLLGLQARAEPVAAFAGDDGLALLSSAASASSADLDAQADGMRFRTYPAEAGRNVGPQAMGLRCMLIYGAAMSISVH